MAAVTKNIGLIATATTSYNEPYNIARRFASLDHISLGRAGWNVVTSANASEALNFGRDSHLEHGDRYKRAAEFLDVVRGLWDSWDDDAFVRDRQESLYFHPDKLHVLAHKGDYFSVRGPLNVARPPQGHPVLVQAGSSDTGRAFAAEHAEIVFSQQQTLETAQAFYKDMKTRASKVGRGGDQILIMPGLNPIVARTEAEAREAHEFLQSKIHPDVGREIISTALGGIDLSKVPLDEPLPADIGKHDTNTAKSTVAYTLSMAQRDGLTLRQLYQRYAGARGQRTIIGTPKQVADFMEEWFVGEGVDGFLIQPSYLPGGLNEFSELVIPELQRRGLFHNEYAGRTLRENLGLKRPASRYAT
jgi:alkanesulfonate monooxygenase